MTLKRAACLPACLAENASPSLSLRLLPGDVFLEGVVRDLKMALGERRVGEKGPFGGVAVCVCVEGEIFNFPFCLRVSLKSKRGGVVKGKKENQLAKGRKKERERERLKETFSSGFLGPGHLQFRQGIRGSS